MEHLTMARDWAEVQAMMNGTTPADELQKLASRNGMKLESMGREVGMCYQAVMAMCKRHGYVKPHCKSFVFRGETASLMSHCKKYGLCNNTVIQYAQRNGISKADALELYVTNQVKKHHWGVPQS